MPAPKSVLREEKRPFAPVDTANKLFRKVLSVTKKMPKRLTYLLLMDFLGHARRVRDCTKMGNSVFATNEHEKQMRIDYWLEARAELQALASGLDDFLEMPDTLTYKDSGKTKGVTLNELGEIADLINQESALITKQLEIERNR